MKPFLDQHARLHLDRVFDTYSHRTALVAPSGTFTFRDIQQDMARVIARLRGLGVGQGQLVGIHAPDSLIHIYLFLAAWVMGFTWVPLDPKAPPGKVPAGVNLDVIVFSGDTGIWPVRVISSEALYDPDTIRPNNTEPGNTEQDNTGPASISQPSLSPSGIPLDRECAVIFTSGSTGGPKGVVHTVGSFYYSALGSVEFFTLTPEDSWLISLPLFHVGGILVVLRTLLSGGTAILHESPGRPGPAILKYRPTFLSLVPTQLQRLLDMPEMTAALSVCRGILLGGAPCPGPLMEKALDTGIPVLATYGSTEACAMVTAVRPGAARPERFSSGRVLPYRKVMLAEDSRVVISGKTLFNHYIENGRPKKGVRDGKFYTQDLGTWDVTGNLIITGRRDLVFMSGGENIHPHEIENAMVETGLVQEAVVVPVDDPVFGRVPWAFVLSEIPLDPARIQSALKKKLPSYKIPKTILPLPPTAMEKGIKRDRNALEKTAAAMVKQ